MTFVDLEHKLIAVPDAQFRVCVQIRVLRLESKLGETVVENVVLLDENAGAEFYSVREVPIRMDGESAAANVVCLLENGNVYGEPGLFSKGSQEIRGR